MLPIFFAGYFPLFLSPMLVIGLKTNMQKIAVVCEVYSLAAAMNVIALGILGWDY